MLRAPPCSASQCGHSLQAVAFGREFADTVRFTSSPQIVERVVMFGVLGPLARLAGRRGSYQEYTRRQLPVVDLEPLPPDVAALIPSLSGRPHDIDT